jgi:cellobiose phosphorylase
MSSGATASYTLPAEDELSAHRLSNASGLEISVLLNGCVFAIEHVRGDQRTLINQVFGSPLGSGIGRILLRVADRSAPIEIAGPGALTSVATAADRFIWEGATADIRHRVTLRLDPDEPLWFWHVEVENLSAQPLTCDAVLIQDLGLGARGLVLSNEAYASQYIDHTIGDHPQFGPVIMCRQNMEQFGRNPWAAHGCIEGAASFATDAMQVFGPGFREAGELSAAYGQDLPGEKLQHEAACAALQSKPRAVAPGSKASLTFFGLFEAHHAEATSIADLGKLEAIDRLAQGGALRVDATPAGVPRSVLQAAQPLSGISLSSDAVSRAYPECLHEERRDGELLSFFIPDGAHNRHIVMAAKERQMRRRHGAVLRTGSGLLPDETTMSATLWMHGVFGAQATIGNTALHKLFSVSRDPFNITRASGMRILVDRGGSGWRLLALPSIFEIGLSDCGWHYQFDDGAISVHAVASAEDTAIEWHVIASGAPCRFMLLGHVVMGEHDFRHGGEIGIDDAAKRMTFRPSPDWLWGQTYPRAVHHLVSSTPDSIEAIGSGSLLFDADAPRDADAYAVIRTKTTERFSFALVGSLTDPAHAAALAEKYAAGIDPLAARAKVGGFWSRITRETRFPHDTAAGAALDTIFPWFAHDAMVHLSVPRGLEQYTAAAWGTRDVCQGPIEFLLPLGHSDAVRDILRIVFAQQYERAGDWPQWFMLDPYGQIRDRHSHGDVIVWPLKALCDYLEATGDFAFLEEPVAWTGDDFTRTDRRDPIAAHVDTLLNTVRERFIPGTHLIRYGLGDWNDSLQPADPTMRDWMVSSWTVALLYQQFTRFAALMETAGQRQKADDLRGMAAAMRADFNRHLMPDGTVAGYALFKEGGGDPEWLLHPGDERMAINYSLIPMTRSMIARLFTPEQARHHLRIIREHLLYPDGARLMDHPVAYHGGLEVNFRRAESASFFGREIGLMYSHSHLRYCEALGVLGEVEAAREALALVNPISVTEVLPNASLRQRNAYFSSSDAAFRDRAEASSQWSRVRDGTVPVDGGWRVYSSGAGIYTRLALMLRAGA